MHAAPTYATQMQIALQAYVVVLRGSKFNVR